MMHNLDVTDNGGGGSLNGTMKGPRTPSTHHKNGSTYHSNPGTLQKGHYSPHTPNGRNGHHSNYMGSESLGDISLTTSPTPSVEAKMSLLHPKVRTDDVNLGSVFALIC